MNKRYETYTVTTDRFPSTVWTGDAHSASDAIAAAKRSFRITGMSMIGMKHGWKADKLMEEPR